MVSGAVASILLRDGALAIRKVLLAQESKMAHLCWFSELRVIVGSIAAAYPYRDWKDGCCWLVGVEEFL